MAVVKGGGLVTKWTGVFSVQLLVGHHAHSHHDICIITFIHGVIIINNVHLFSGRFEGLPSLVDRTVFLASTYVYRKCKSYYCIKQ